MDRKVSPDDIARWMQEPDVLNLQSRLKCGPWAGGVWNDVCDDCKEISQALGSILQSRDEAFAQREALMGALNEVSAQKCTACKRELGSNGRLWSCGNKLHLATFDQIANLSGNILLGFDHCVRCGKLSLRSWDEGVREPGHMLYGGGWFCYSCWHNTFEDRR